MPIPAAGLAAYGLNTLGRIAARKFVQAALKRKYLAGAVGAAAVASGAENIRRGMPRGMPGHRGTGRSRGVPAPAGHKRPRAGRGAQGPVPPRKRARTAPLGRRGGPVNNAAANNSVTAGQWTQARRVIGRKMPAKKHAEMVLKQDIDRVRYQFRGYSDGFEKSGRGLLGWWPLYRTVWTSGQTSGLSVTGLPVYMLHLTGAANALPPYTSTFYGAQGVTADVPLWQLAYHQTTPSAVAGLISATPGYYWYPVNGVANTGAIGSNASPLLIFDQTTTGLSLQVSSLGQRAVCDWAHVKMNLWGCTGCASKFRITECSPRDDTQAPEANCPLSNAALLSYPTSGAVGFPFGYWGPGLQGANAADTSEHQTFWSARVAKITDNPIATQNTKANGAWKMGKSYTHIVAPKTTIETDGNPEVQTLDMHININKRYRFDRTQECIVAPGTGANAPTEFGIQQGAEPAPYPAKNRKYLLIENFNYGVLSNAQAFFPGYNATNSSNAPSFDLNFRNQWSRIP